MRRIEYAGSVHDREEIDAVVAVLEAGAGGLRIVGNVREFEAAVAELFGKGIVDEDVECICTAVDEVLAASAVGAGR